MIGIGIGMIAPSGAEAKNMIPEERGITVCVESGQNEINPTGIGFRGWYPEKKVGIQLVCKSSKKEGSPWKNEQNYYEGLVLLTTTNVGTHSNVFIGVGVATEEKNTHSVYNNISSDFSVSRTSVVCELGNEISLTSTGNVRFLGELGYRHAFQKSGGYFDTPDNTVFARMGIGLYF
ncbi:hypothetical protein KKA83_02965 [Patescibacteria group bacterium]|nr:hypothetical protein [Patescibacteria group bacterium]